MSEGTSRPNPAEVLEEFGDIVLPSATILASERLHVKAFNALDRNMMTGQNAWLRAGVNVLGPAALSVATIMLTKGEIARSVAVGGGIASLENAFSQVTALPDPLDFAGDGQSGQDGLGATAATSTGGGMLNRTASPRAGDLEAGDGDSGLLGAGDGLGAASVSERTLETDSSFL